jgi:signal peptidase I
MKNYVIFGIFLLGLLVGTMSQIPVFASLEAPFGISEDISSPSDWIAEENILVYSDYAQIDVSGLQWAKFTDTNSMDPIFDEGANVLQKVPLREELTVGDIISYGVNTSEYLTIHRIVEIGSDSDGWYVITKGDNNPTVDIGKVRFNQVEKVVVAVIY